MAKLAPDELAQDRQRPQPDFEAVLERRLVDHGLCQRLILRLANAWAGDLESA